MDADLLGETRFRSAGFGRSGYDREQVDTFVDELRAALRGRSAAMAPYEVADKRFRVRRFAAAYSMREVDAYLDRAEEALRERHGEDAVAGITGHGSAPTRVSTWWVYAVALVLVLIIAGVVGYSLR